MTTRSSLHPKSKKEKTAVATKWNAADYAANSAVQQTWARELIARLNLRGDEHILDIGCGDGKVTAEIARALPRGSVTGADASPHWVDDHQAILRGAAAVLKPGGRLVVSCGGKGNAHDVFLALRPEMRLKRWREFFRKMEAPYFF